MPKISDLPDGGDLQPGDKVAIVRNGATLGSVELARIVTVQPGVGIGIDDSDPMNPVINNISPAPYGTIQSVQSGVGISVDNTDPDNPIVSADYRSATDSGTNANVPDSWTQLCSVTLATEVGGLYMLTATATYSINSTSNAAMFRTTGDFVSQEYMMESKDSDDVRPISISIPYVATGVSTTINLEAAKEKPQSALDISYSSITLHRIG